MTAYGQTVTPKWYRDTTPKQMTKYEFAQTLVKALRAVGMVPIRQWWPNFKPANAGAENAASAGRVDLDSVDISTITWLGSGYQWPAGFFAFDYPTTDTFAVNGVAYRPIVIVAALQFVSTGVNNVVGEQVKLIHARRRADRFQMSDILTIAKAAFPTAGNGQNNYGIGGPTDGATSPTNFGVGRLGSAVILWNWQPAPAQTDAQHTVLLAVNNFHVILSKSGLLVQVGSGTGRLDSNNILNCGFYFGGARVPGRARVPAQDGNLNLIDPVVFIPHQDTDNSGIGFWESSFSIGSGSTALTVSGTHPAGVTLGLQHDLGYTHVPVWLRLYNIENLQRPFFPFYDIDTKGSPRQVDSVGSHILNRIVYMSFNAYNTSTYYGAIDTTLRIEPVPPWEDIWTFPWWRVADRSAPNGEYVDPSTSINWWLYYVQNMNCMFAVEVEGLTKLSSLPTYGAPAQVAQTTFSMASGFGGVVGAAVSNVLEAGTTNWTATAATDEATFKPTTVTQTAHLLWVLAGSNVSSDPADYAYKVSFQAYNKCPAGATSQPALTFEVSRDGGSNWNTLLSLACAGTNSGDPAFAYATYTFDLPRSQQAEEFRFRFRVARASGSGTLDVGVKDVRLTKLQ